jgi:hypothetical protein
MMTAQELFYWTIWQLAGVYSFVVQNRYIIGAVVIAGGIYYFYYRK